MKKIWQGIKRNFNNYFFRILGQYGWTDWDLSTHPRAPCGRLIAAPTGGCQRSWLGVAASLQLYRWSVKLLVGTTPASFVGSPLRGGTRVPSSFQIIRASGYLHCQLLDKSQFTGFWFIPLSIPLFEGLVSILWICPRTGVYTVCRRQETSVFLTPVFCQTTFREKKYVVWTRPLFLPEKEE